MAAAAAAPLSTLSPSPVIERPSTFCSFPSLRRLPLLSPPKSRHRLGVLAVHETKEAESAPRRTSSSSSAEETTEKYGLEVGLWKVFSSKEEGEGKSRTEQAKGLLAKYGGAYLATSITLSLISFSLCYLLVNAGIDVPGLLLKVGITVDETGGKVGTFALAYAAHKAASPIRFPPTVALTPVVAGWIGKKSKAKEGGGGEK